MFTIRGTAGLSGPRFESESSGY